MHQSKIVIRLADWEKDKTALRAIRSQVFIKEQKVPEDMEWDEFDASATHFLAQKNGLPIACARLKADGQIGRMAVLVDYRNAGTGTKLLQFVLQTSAEKSLDSVYLHAQVTAIAFYEKHGFVSLGDVFYEAGIPHRAMLKTIR